MSQTKISERTPDSLVPTRDVAAYLNCSIRTLVGWKDYGPPYVKVSNKRRYRWGDVQAWLNAQTWGGDLQIRNSN